MANEFGVWHLMTDKNDHSGKDGLLLNKIAGAVLGSFLTIMVVREVGGALYHPQNLETPAYAIEVPESNAHGAVEVEVVDFSTLLANADSAKGERLAKKCVQCHTFDKGGKNGTGPNLWGIIGRASASVAGFNYSSALSALSGSWSFDEMSNFLENPKGYVKGTAMSFAGLRKPQDRANLMVYLRTLDDNPLPLPEAPTAEDVMPDVDMPADH